MAFNFARKTNLNWDDAVAAVKTGLKEQGFGVLTEIDIQATLRERIGTEMRRYRILGACNPAFAKEAIEKEVRIGVLLPCNVVVRELEDGTIEVATINPAETMKAVGNPGLESVAAEIGARLERMLGSLT